MSIIFRVLLAIYAFCLTIISFISIYITFSPGVLNVIVKQFNSILQNKNYFAILFVIEFLFLMLSFWFLSSGFKSSSDKRAITKFTKFGEIKISLHSIENIVLVTAKKHSSVRDTKAYVKKTSDSVSINIKIIVLPEVNIPLISEEIQNRVKSAVEETSGVKVNYVKVLVENIYAGYKSRVE